MENTVHWVRDVVFGEDESQVRTHRKPAVLAAFRDLIHSALKVAGYVNTAAGRRAHTEGLCVLDPHDITRPKHNAGTAGVLAFACGDAAYAVASADGNDGEDQQAGPENFH